MKCLVYGIYILEVVQTVIVTEIVFRTFVTSLGDVQIFDRVEMEWLVPTLTTIGELSCTEHERLMSNIPPRYILCPRILCISDQKFGKIEESRGSNYCRKFLKAAHRENAARYTALFHSTWRWVSNWGSYGAEETLHLARGRQNDGLRMEYHCGMDSHASLFPII